jgi:hypothetical protein
MEKKRPSLEIEMPRPNRRRKIVWWTLWLSTAAIVIVSTGSYLIHRPRRNHEFADVCASCLNNIGREIQMYSDSHQGNFPDSFATLLADHPEDAGNFVCPKSSDVCARGGTTQAVLNDFAKPGHCSYIYLGAGLNTKTVDAQEIVAYEPVTNHGGIYAHVLFGDLHAEAVQAASLSRVFAQGSAAHRAATMPLQ